MCVIFKGDFDLISTFETTGILAYWRQMILKGQYSSTNYECWSTEYVLFHETTVPVVLYILYSYYSTRALLSAVLIVVMCN